MKLVLVNLLAIERKGFFRTNYWPLGLVSLAATAREKGWEVEIISPIVDFLLLKKQSGDVYKKWAKKILITKPDLVGMTTCANSYCHTLLLAEKLKKKDSIPIILGGPQATVVAKRTLVNFWFIDFILRGEADFSFGKFLEAFREKADFSLVPGLTYRLGKKIKENEKSLPIRDLDSLPLPAFDLLAGGFYPKSRIEVGRGCPFNCSFCTTSLFFSRNLRYKSPERIYRELRLVKKFFPENSFSFIHDNLTVDKQRLRGLCNFLKKAEQKFVWHCDSRVDCLEKEDLRLMKQAGCESVFLGIETGSVRMQKLINKNINLEKIKDVLKNCSEIGIKTTCSFIIGFPQEKKGDLLATLSLILKCLDWGASRVQTHLLSPLPGCSLAKEYKEKLVFSRMVFGDFGGAILPEHRNWIKKYPDVFQSVYVFKHNVFSFEELLVFAGFGSFMGKFRRTIKSAVVKKGENFLLDFCLSTARVLKRNFSKLEADSIINQAYLMRLFVSEFKKILDLDILGSEARDLFFKELF